MPVDWRRFEIRDITEHGLSVPDAAASHGVGAPTARKWRRHLSGGVSSENLLSGAIDEVFRVANNTAKRVEST